MRSWIERRACSAVIAATLIMSSATAPRDRSLHGRASPWRIGPTAVAAGEPLNELVGDVARVERREHEHVRPTGRPPAGRLSLARRRGTSAASPCNSPSTARLGRRARMSASASRTRSMLAPSRAAAGAEREERHARLVADDPARGRAAAAIAMSASCSRASAHGTTAQSVNVSTSGLAPRKCRHDHVERARDGAHARRGPTQSRAPRAARRLWCARRPRRSRRLRRARRCRRRSRAACRASRSGFRARQPAPLARASSSAATRSRIRPAGRRLGAGGSDLRAPPRRPGLASLRRHEHGPHRRHASSSATIASTCASRSLRERRSCAASPRRGGAMPSRNSSRQRSRQDACAGRSRPYRSTSARATRGCDEPATRPRRIAATSRTMLELM